jgi:hypothetical protein
MFSSSKSGSQEKLEIECVVVHGRGSFQDEAFLLSPPTFIVYKWRHIRLKYFGFSSVFNLKVEVVP